MTRMPERETHLLEKDLRAALPELRLLRDEPMKHHCSFRIGGPAALFAEPASEEELTALRRFLWKRGAEPVVIGSGTNLLIADAGLTAQSMVIRIGEGLDAIAFDDGATVYAGAGVALSRLALAARDRGLSGLEFAHGIPGSLGGGVAMNAGAYGGEMKDVVASARYLDAAGEVHETPDLDFAYRHSRFTTGGDGSVILGATLCLTPGDPSEIGARMRELMARRAASQPLDKPSAGSTFKRPANGYAAALIDGAGLKGFTIGGAQVSEKHAGFVVNAGNATCDDVLKLMEHIQKTVETRFGVLLEPEVKILR